MLGTSVSAGDVNGDGFSDVVIGAPANDSRGINSGRAYLYLGGVSGSLDVADGVFNGEFPARELGHAVSSAGDVDGDGFADVLVSEGSFQPSAKPLRRWNALAESPGRLAYLYRGGRSLPMDIPVASSLESSATDSCAIDASGLGDINQDGFADFMAGINFCVSTDRVRLYLGSKALDVDVDVALSSNLTVTYLHGASKLGDVNGDGLDDIAVSGTIDSQAVVRIFLGRAGEAAETLVLPAVGAAVGTSAAGFGRAFAGADLNGDGFKDLVVGAPQDSSIASFAGRVYVYFGAPGGAFESSADLILSGAAGDTFGSAISE